MTENLPAVRKVDRSWRKVFRRHGNLTESDGSSSSYTECRRKDFWLHRKLTEVYKKSTRCKESWQKVFGCTKVYKKHERPPGSMEKRRKFIEGHTESWRMFKEVFWWQGKLTEVYLKAYCRQKGGQQQRKVSQRQRNVIEIYGRSPSHAETWWTLTKFSRPHRKSTEFYGMSYYRMER